MPDRRLQPFREIWRKLNGLALYRLCDTDQPSARVLLGHGNGLTAATCQALAQALSRHFDVIAFDSRGHGASDVPTTFHRVNNWDRFADDQLMLSDALSKMPELAPLPLHLVVHSINAVAALRSLNRNPRAFQSYQLLDPVLIPIGQSIGLSIARPLGLAARLHPLAAGATKRRTEWPSFADAEQYLIGRKSLANWPTEAVKAYIYSGMKPSARGNVVLRCPAHHEAKYFVSMPPCYLDRPINQGAPCHIIRGEQGATNLDRLDRVQRRHNNLIVTTMPGHDHFGLITHPDETASAIIRSVTSTNEQTSP